MDPPTTLHYHDSVESASPTCGQWGDSLPPPKLRLMCSYGGHIIPRPHDKSLCYMGGETRIVVADRHTSLADLCSRLSTNLLNGRQFTIKYQLPNEDLDSLVSVTTDEDLDNMVEEYDRLNSSNNPSSRLRLFLFLSKPETAASMGSLLDDAKSETWFVDALNGAGLLPRGLSDSVTIDNLLEHKDNNNSMERAQLSLPDSPLVETTTSSFGSSSSSPSMSNLPPIKVKVNDQMAGLDEQLNVNVNVNVGAVPPPVGGGSSDERSDHSGGMRKPPLPLQPLQRKFVHDPYSLPSPDSKHCGAYGLHSPDSVASDSSMASGNKTTFTQDQNAQSNRDTPTPPATTQIYPTPTPTSTINYQTPITDTQLPPSLTQDQQQLYQPRPHFIQHHTTTNQPPQPYYPLYAPPPQMDNQQYPLYFLPVTQNHPYLQSNATDSASSAATPLLYPTKTVNKPTNSMYGTTTQQPYMNVQQIPHHPLPTCSGGMYVHSTQDPVYYSQVPVPLPSQYQSMTPESAMLLAQASSAPETAKQ